MPPLPADDRNPGPSHIRALRREVRSIIVAHVLDPGGCRWGFGIDGLGELGGMLTTNDGRQPGPELSRVRCKKPVCGK